MRAIETCRTAALGGHVDQCGHCAHLRISYNSCRNRHCPKCQGRERAAWLAQRQAELLPIEYYHVVFTLPAPLAALALQNQSLLYGLLFRLSAETLLTIARDPRHLGAEIGFFSLLHTWGQNLHHHPHVHCVVTGGGLAPGYERFQRCRPGFFLSVRVLSRLFRRLFLAALAQVFQRGELHFAGDLQPLAATPAFHAWLRQLGRGEWVVYAQPPFGGPSAVLAYLARYTHRVAISNERLVSLSPDAVTFRWKDYRHADQPRLLTLSPHEFIRRFLLHALPPGFQRIRHYGLLANAHRRDKLALCRRLLAHDPTGLLPDTAACPVPAPAASEEPAPPLCPVCRIGHLRRIDSFAPGVTPRLDSS